MIDLRNTCRGKVPHVPFRAIASSVLGPDYELSLTLCGDTLARRMNRTYRHKGYSPNVLSFPYGKNEGEIFLNPRKAARECAAFGRSYREHLARLYIHGCLHLKGYAHGKRMEREEEKILKVFMSGR